MKGKLLVLMLLAVAIGLIVSIPASAGVDAVYSDGTWHKAQISTGSYAALAADSQTTDVIYGAAPGGGLDQVSYSGTWGTAPITFADGTPGVYTALSADPLTAKFVYGARATGGADVMFYDSAWHCVRAVGASTIYNDIEADPQTQRALAASAAGGVEMVFNFGGTWNANPITFDIGTPGTYTSMAAITVNGWTMWFAVRADNGIDYMYFDTFWRVYNVLPNEPTDDVKFTSICADAVGTQLYAAREDGSVARIFPYNTNWYASAMTFAIGTPGTYTRLTTDAVLSQTFFAARSGGGVDVLYFDTWWRVYQLYTSPTYTTLEGDSQTGWWVYGSSGPSGTTGKLIGHVDLQDFVGDTDLRPIRIQLTPVGGGDTRTDTVFLDAAGDYKIEGINVGTYNVHFKASSFLGKDADSPVTITGGGTTPCDISLTNGDVDDDGTVTTTDLSTVLKNLSP